MAQTLDNVLIKTSLFLICLAAISCVFVWGQARNRSILVAVFCALDCRMPNATVVLRCSAPMVFPYLALCVWAIFSNMEVTSTTGRKIADACESSEVEGASGDIMF